MNPGLQIIEKSIRNQITEELDKIGLHYRIFSRIKDDPSIKEKLSRKEIEGEPYRSGEKHMQDIIGLRVVTYFIDDIDIALIILEKKLAFQSKQIDDHGLTVFKPKRTNIICELRNKDKEHLTSAIAHKKYGGLIDPTYELQLRTILSEGWHEIDHSLRYKCKDDWKDHTENERLLNGIYASLETNDIALKNLFNELSYKHFKKRNWEALIRNKLRLKFQMDPLLPDLVNLFNLKPELAKGILKMDRKSFLADLYELDLGLPINLNNIVFLFNSMSLKDESITALTPSLIKELVV